MSLFTRLLRFALVGGLCFLVQWSAVHELRNVIHPFVADLIAFVFSAQVNFWLSKTITWHDREQARGTALLKQWGRYNVVAILLGGCNALLFVTAERLFNEVTSVLIAVAICTAISFGVNHFYVFLDRNKLPFLEYSEVDLTEVAHSGIAIFMPAYNEAKNLAYVVGEAVGYFHSQQVPFTVIVVDDGSSDDTATVARSLRSTFPEVRLVEHERNQGYGAALRTGFKAALQSGYEWIGYCDSDGQFKPYEFGKLISQAVNNEADICIGYRLKRADGLKRWLMGRGWHILSRLVLGYEAVDIDCGFKVFRRHAVVALDRSLIGDHATISPEILARAHRNGNKIVEVGVNHYPREYGEQSGSNLRVVRESLVGLTTVRRTLRQENR